MIVKFLAKSTTFKGVRYNTNKMENNKGELMKVSGFGSLQGFTHLEPRDYINYLKLVSARNKRIVYPQLHAVISAKGTSSGKEELTSVAEKWLKGMGYGDQPYLIVYHKDTGNNHVHIVSTRVDQDGSKISSAFEKIRALKVLNRVMDVDQVQQARLDLQTALRYNFSTKAQFMLILETRGYVLKSSPDGKFQMIKFGKKLLEFDMADVTERIKNSVFDQARADQLIALLHKYRLEYSAKLVEQTVALPGGLKKNKGVYTSDLAVFIKEKFGIQLIFHGMAGLPAYGYTIVDHNKRNVYKGGEIMDLGVLTKDIGVTVNGPEVLRSELTAYVPPAMHELIQEDVPLELEGPLSPVDTFEPYDQKLSISISDDIDDEAIHGRNRHRKRKARTNAR